MITSGWFWSYHECMDSKSERSNRSSRFGTRFSGAISRFWYSGIIVQCERCGGLTYSGPFGDISDRRLFIWPMIIGVFIHLAKNLRGVLDQLSNR